MTPRVDAIIHIASVPDLIAYFAANEPDHLSDDGLSIVGFDRTPTAINGESGLVYVRVRADQVDEWSSTPGVTILAQAPYSGSGTPDAVYSSVFSDEEMTALYEAVFDRSNGDRFGQMWG